MDGHNGRDWVTSRLLLPLMDNLVPWFVFMLSALLFLAFLRMMVGTGGPPRPVAKPFLTARKAAMLEVLEQLLPMYRLHAQVAMGALLKVPAFPGWRATQADRNSFSQKIVDYVVQDPTTGIVVALIELDGRARFAQKDGEREAMLAYAGYRTFRIPRSTPPSIPAVLTIIGSLRDDALGSAATAHVQ
ncbi:DUF2726 domain-containing protein [Sphingobium sp. CFD-2]|uniref:DUF2726 domain-containing protein n=1 Tax=Sphingobium sp. CFD-2 TaxID=2878542 RepID=UPI00214B727A|nr:DUF2726 domain-containing protein [Sphingobium sp. CFD-2]